MRVHDDDGGARSRHNSSLLKESFKVLCCCCCCTIFPIRKDQKRKALAFLFFLILLIKAFFTKSFFCHKHHTIFLLYLPPIHSPPQAFINLHSFATFFHTNTPLASAFSLYLTLNLPIKKNKHHKTNTRWQIK